MGSEAPATTAPAHRVLVVDDEPSITELVATVLRYEGFQVKTAASGRKALAAVTSFRPHLMVLDVMLPDLDGFEIQKRLAADGTRTPILFLSARDAAEDKVHGLTMGADDYVTKPFSAEELLARVRAALRRADGLGVTAGLITRGDLAIDVDRRRVMRGADELRLTPKEFELLVFLAQHPGRVLTHRAILKAIWGPNAVDQPEHLRVLVNALRRKLELAPARPKYILTEPWVGYRFADL